MDRPMDACSDVSTQPERLSALYQYHNAPEVAPAHGLEYDDTIYPISDKYPVMHITPTLSQYRYTGKHAFQGDNRPPRIIFGMKVRTFLVVATVMILIITGAAVGGAVGGANLRQNFAQQNNGLSSNSSTSVSSAAVAASSTAATSTTSTFSAAVPTYTPLSDCPASNGTTYTSSFAQGSSGTVPSTADLAFKKFCDVASPLTSAGTRITEAFVYSFNDCIDVCASYNFWHANANCTVAVYEPTGSRPGNCWVGSVVGVSATGLGTVLGTDVAVLET